MSRTCTTEIGCPARSGAGVARGGLQATVGLVLVMGMMLPNPAQAAATIIRAARLLDVASGQVAEGMDILVEGNRIREVGRGLVMPPDAVSIDLGDVTVLPGLIDAHTHVCLEPEDEIRVPVLHKTDAARAIAAMAAAQRDLWAGFTTLRDLDNEGADMADLAVRDAVRRGVFTGPRLFVAGWAISITGGHMNLTGLQPSVDRRLTQLALMVDGPQAMVAAIRDQAKAGVDLIKIYATGALRNVDRGTLDAMPQFSRDEMRLMVEEAARWRLDVAAHAYGGRGALDAVAAGVRSIEHGMFLDDATLDLMASKGTFWCPTMTAYLPGPDDAPDDRAFHERIVQRHRETFRRAMKKGVKIAFGTDAGSFAHGDNRRELQRMVDYGMSPIDVLRSATLTGAALLRREHDLGRIAPGYLADIIAVAGRPDRDIAALRAITFIMADGTIVRQPGADR